MVRVVLLSALVVVLGFTESRPQDETAERIMGGQVAGQQEFPGALALLDSEKDRFVCGASIMNRNWGLTAAHCVIDNGVAIAGATNYTEGTRHYIKFFVKNEVYSESYLENDIAVFQVETPFSFDGPAVQPVTLADFDEVVPAGSTVTAIGWGLLDHSANRTTVLQKIDMVIQNRTTRCLNDYRVICLESPSEAKGICSGDSGSPLFWKGKVVGLTSYGVRRGCNVGYEEIVYTRISAYMSWIAHHIAFYQ